MSKKVYKYLGEIKKFFSSNKAALEHINALYNLIDVDSDKNSINFDDNFAPQVTGDNIYCVFSDGACRGNPGPGAWGAMAQDGVGNILFKASGVDTQTTNNRMELLAAIEGLERLHKQLSKDVLKSATVHLYSDSRHVVDGMNEWIDRWKMRGWKNSEKKPPKNLELWKRLDEISNQYSSLNYFWVQGHSGHPQNEFCDRLANDALDNILT